VFFHVEKEMKKQKPEWRVVVEMLEKVDLVLLNRILRRMIYYLHTSNVKDISELMKDLEPSYNSGNDSSELYTNVPNPKLDLTALRVFTERVFQVAEKNIPDQEISKQLETWLSQERTRFFSIAVENINISLVQVKDVLKRFFNIPKSELHLSPDEFVNIRVSLSRRFLSSTLRYINIAKHYIRVKDFHGIVRNTIGAARSTGRLGGKTAGLVLGHQILDSELEKYPELSNVRVPRSWYITSDTILDFIHYNALEEVTSLKYQDMDQIRTGYPYLQQLFKNSFFPPEIVDQLELLLEHIGNKPIIIRSSSLLEDSFKATFAGKYKSLFLSNTGELSKRLNALLDAIAEIYASIFGPDPIEYRKERGLVDFQEEMGILIQEVVGTKVDKYFFPTYAGVAFSSNDFRWSPRIKRDDGMVRLVAGLGTRAVDRVGNDYPFLASPGKPGLKVNISNEDILKYSQRYIDVLNLETNKFETLSMDFVLKEYGDSIPGIEKIISIHKNDNISPPIGIMWDPKESDMVVTFQNLTDNSKFLKQMHIILNSLKEAFGSPVDVEFASDGNELYILQCRPQGQSKAGNAVKYPEHIAKEDIVFLGNKHITPGYLPGIKYIIYVTPQGYQSLEKKEELKEVAVLISRLNHLLPSRSFILAGPGRWGSRGDIKLGVQVAYSDINKTAMLMELAYSKDGYMPDLSFGTHFFQDLVESDIKYLPLYPETEGSFFNKELLMRAENLLLKLIPEAGSMMEVIKVVDFGNLRKEGKLNVVMDGDGNRAIGYIEPALMPKS